MNSPIINNIPASDTIRRRVETLYKHLEIHFGPTGWWPADTPFEMAIGAILTQNTAWSNVEKAIDNLKKSDCLTPTAIMASTKEQLEELIHPSGFFRQKSERLKRFCDYLIAKHGGDMARMARIPLKRLRTELLSINGIGPETADDILLYACEKPIFVVDAYTRRIFSRHSLVPADIDYDALQHFFHQHLPPDIQHYKELHGLIVWTGKYYCSKQPKCDGCPLHTMLQKGEPVLE